MTLTVQDLVAREVHYCVSSLVSTLAQGAGYLQQNSNAHPFRDSEGPNTVSLCHQALELASPIDDWAEAAIQTGWEPLPAGGFKLVSVRGLTQKASDTASWADLCEAEEIEPYQREVFEHWIVSDWLADKLAEHGEKVDKDFAGMTVWARTTTGQAIAADGVIEQILAELLAA